MAKGTPIALALKSHPTQPLLIILIRRLTSEFRHLKATSHVNQIRKNKMLVYPLTLLQF